MVGVQIPEPLLARLAGCLGIHFLKRAQPGRRAKQAQMAVRPAGANLATASKVEAVVRVQL